MLWIVTVAHLYSKLEYILGFSSDKDFGHFLVNYNKAMYTVLKAEKKYNSIIRINNPDLKMFMPPKPKEMEFGRTK